MRCFLYTCCVAMVVGISSAFAQDAIPSQATDPIPETVSSAAELPPGMVGRVSVASGNVDLRMSGESNWAATAVNQPVYSGEGVRTGPQARAEIEVGANTVDLAEGTEIVITMLTDKFTQIALSRGRSGVSLRQIGDEDTVEIDFAQGGLWLLGAGRYDLDVAGGDQPTRITVFEGTAQFVGGGSETRIETGQMAVLAGADTVTATTEAARADDFVEWCRSVDYDQTRLAAPHYLSKYMTGFAELDTAGIWKINSEYGPIWFPTDPEWSPYRFGHWGWIAPWGWTWIDDQPWGFAPSHYGRWVMIDDHWAWAPGGSTVHPLFAPAVVAFLGTPGIGLSSEDGATVAWFPLAPGETYWPTYTQDMDYIRSLNFGNVPDTEAIQMPADGAPRLEFFHEDFANRRFSTAVPRSVFINGRPAAPARVSLPEQRLQNAPVLMGSPQIAPPSAQPVASVPKPSLIRVVVRTPRKGGAKIIRAALLKSRGRDQPVVLRGAHLHVPSYAGQARGRQLIMLRVAHIAHGGARH